MRLIDYFHQNLDQEKAANQLGLYKLQLRIANAFSNEVLAYLHMIYNWYNREISEKEAEQKLYEDHKQWQILKENMLDRVTQAVSQENEAYCGARELNKTGEISQEEKLQELIKSQKQLYTDLLSVSNWEAVKYNYQQIQLIHQQLTYMYESANLATYNHVDKMGENHNEVELAVDDSFEHFRKHSLVSYCASGDLKTIKKDFKQLKSELNTYDFGVYPLHVACQEGHIELARWLYQRGAKAGLKDAFGKTANDYLTDNGYTLETLTTSNYWQNLKSGLRLFFCCASKTTKRDCSADTAGLANQPCKNADGSHQFTKGNAVVSPAPHNGRSACVAQDENSTQASQACCVSK